MYTAIKMNRVKKSIQKATFIRKKQNLFKKPRKSIQKKHTLPKTNIKKNKVL